jgi:phenylacetate-coenzyme A ligase PaaK-like adenylate-forming protein
MGTGGHKLQTVVARHDGEEMVFLCGAVIRSAAVESALAAVGGLGGEFQLILSEHLGIPRLTLRVESSARANAEQRVLLETSAGEAFRATVGRAAWVEVLPPGTLARGPEREKRPRIVDLRRP